MAFFAENCRERKDSPMQFNSIGFIFAFLPAFLLVYYCLPLKLRGFGTIIGSLVFYWFSCGRQWPPMAILCALTILTYPISRALAKPGRGFLLAFSLALLGVILTFFKLYDGGKHLPAGMSFFLFQIAAYLIDIYRNRLLPEKNFLPYAQQITLFPKLLSGPLVQPRELQLQIRYPHFKFNNIREGLLTLIPGLALKVLIANRLGGLWSQTAGVGYDNISTPFAWLALIAYDMKLYFDFYGYSLMAVGIGRMLGFELPQNFLTPYASRSVSEFYRRWHASLGAWFRDYLYIPLGGSRCSTPRTILNLAIVWLFTGLWHGIGGNYLIWAGVLFLLIVNERLWLGKLLNKSHVLSRVYTVFVIVVTWLPFAIGNFHDLSVYFGKLFGIGTAVNLKDYIIYGQDYVGILAAGLILATPFPRWLWQKLRNTWVVDVLAFILFWVSVYFIATAAQDPFMYFQY